MELSEALYFFMMMQVSGFVVGITFSMFFHWWKA